MNAKDIMREEGSGEEEEGGRQKKEAELKNKRQETAKKCEMKD